MRVDALVEHFAAMSRLPRRAQLSAPLAILQEVSTVDVHARLVVQWTCKTDLTSSGRLVHLTVRVFIILLLEATRIHLLHNFDRVPEDLLHREA